jgi:transposase
MRVGIEAHKKKCITQIFDSAAADGAADSFEPTEMFSFPTTMEGLSSIYQRVPVGSVIVIESSTTGKLLSRILSSKYEVHMVAPPERKPSIKTDARDAARMVREDMLGYSRRCYIPSQYIEELRFHVFQMIQTGGKISRVKNQIHSVLERNMIHALDDLSDPFGREGLERLASSIIVGLPEQDMQALRRHLEELALHARNHRELEIQLAKMVVDDSDVKFLMTIPGMNLFTASATKARIGDDISKFPTKKHLCSYAGLVPGASNSGEYESKHNHVKRGDMIFKYALTCAVRGAVSANKPTSVKTHYLEVNQRTGVAQKAEVAVARKLACIVWSVLKNGSPYVEEDKSLTIRKQKRTEFLAKSKLADSRPDIRELTDQVSACADTIATYPLDLERTLGEHISPDEEETT